jgi:hypothetical protein
MPEYPIDAELVAVSQILAGLSPAAAAVNRDRLLYEAGRRSVRSKPWPVVAGVLAVLSIGLGVRLATMSPRTEIVCVTRTPSEQLATKDGEPPVTVVSESSSEGYVPGSPGYVGLRNQVVRFGADSLPNARPSTGEAVSSVEQMLGLPAGTLDDAQKSRWQHQLF